MRMTVGPLPPAVYWRRRAVVFGAGILFLIVLLNSCQGSDRGGTPEGRSTPTAGPAGTVSPFPDPSGSVLTPQSGAPGGSGNSGGSGDSGSGTSGNPAGPGGGNTGSNGNTGGTGDGSGTGTGTSGSGTNGSGTNGSGTNGGQVGPGSGAAPVVDDGTCTDAEILVTAVAVPTELAQGGRSDLTLKIKNVSQRTCSRDVGADLQELFVKSGAEKVWSSDTCGTGKGSDVQSFIPNFERSYTIGWNGRDTTRCANGVAAGPSAPAGTYQVFARVGTKLSDPAKLTVTAS
ncbi:hypothetical protein [Micromonospora mirobrigensis]|uniref:hypothetical protein n=1 Tax=Micromonospora mirobrigensis TaxID=262898 RepID=UPI000AFF15A7|nr:hypothetical protein [Micromonospora mirobrigensis]